MKKLASTVLIFTLLSTTYATESHADAAEITILSTMVANFTGEGEWGFAALIETETEAILFDSGFKEDTVLNNATSLGKDLSQVEKVILSHFHSDHTGGLLKLRTTFHKDNPKAFSTAYVAQGFFEQRYTATGEPVYSLPNQTFSRSFTHARAFKQAAEALGIKFVIVDGPIEIAPDMILTGPIERVHDEPNVSPGFFVKQDDTLTADTVAESQSLGIRTERGWLLLSGCGHAGIINAAEKLRTVEEQPVHLAVGGFHLFRATEQQISWTAQKLKSFGLSKLVGAHCTGAHATHKIAQSLALPRAHVSIGAIGTRIDQELEIHPGSID